MKRWFQRQQKKKRRGLEHSLFWKQFLYGMLAVICVIALGGLTWYLTRLPMVTITETTITGGETISHETVQSAVQEELTGAYLLLIPKTFSYLYPHDRIKRSIESIPRIHDVVVTKQSNTALAITFEEFVPFALWCLSETTEAPCFFLNETGYAFAPAPPLRGGALIRHVIDDTDELTKTQILPSDLFSSVYTFIHRLETAVGFRVTHVLYNDGNDITYRLSGGGRLLVANDQEVEKTLKNLQSVLNAPQFADLTPETFNYIDLRFGNKVYVHDGTTATPATTTEDTL